MFRLERQVLRTYTTWRWMWLYAPFCGVFVFGSYVSAISKVETFQLLLMTTIFGLAMPIIMGLQWLVIVAKWQFANPRARLLPGYARAHVGVLGVIFVGLLVLHPLCLAAVHDLAPLGSLAFALSLGGMLWACHRNNGLAVAPAMLIFFSGMTALGQHFWFSPLGEYHVLHGLLAALGAALVVGWLWRLAHLNEEMNDYQVAPLGVVGLSRLERAEQRRLQGELAARSRLVATLIDRWHDRPHSNNPAALFRYGFGRISSGLQAVFLGASCAIYGVALYQLHIMQTKTTTPDTLWFPIMIAVAIPSAGAGIYLAQRKQRMAQELLRPATRKQYFDGLLGALVKQTALLWLALQLALTVVVLSIENVLLQEELLPLTAAYFVVSLALQVPAFGLCIAIARWNSLLLQLLSMYAVAGLELLAIWAWWSAREQLGNFSAMALVIVVSLALGGAMIRAAQRSWLCAELG